MSDIAIQRLLLDLKDERDKRRQSAGQLRDVWSVYREATKRETEIILALRKLGYEGAGPEVNGW